MGVGVTVYMISSQLSVRIPHYADIDSVSPLLCITAVALWLFSRYILLQSVFRHVMWRQSVKHLLNRHQVTNVQYDMCREVMTMAVVALMFGESVGFGEMVVSACLQYLCVHHGIRSCIEQHGLI